jgi:chemotaxis methyl-accepting protein methylase/glycosyltransferase involved in cell wall biosynthesis
MISRPLVSVLTPVHNGAAFLAECIESVLRQTYEGFEYIILDAGSVDRSVDIASSYAAKDPRIRVERCSPSVSVMESHNIAFRLISSTAQYCKVVSPEDFLLPECLERMVDVAEQNASVGIVGSYQLIGNQVRWQGFAHPHAVIPGREVCRRVFLGKEPGFGFGTPTSLLYRADLVRRSRDFYPDSAPHSDASACFKSLENSSFGFVFQVLSCGRIHGELESVKSAKINRFASTGLSDLQRYGPLYLTPAEFQQCLTERLNDYHRYLATSVLRSRGKEFWDYHRARLAELGYPLRISQLLTAGVIRLLRELLNPEQAVRRLWLASHSGPHLPHVHAPTAALVTQPSTQSVNGERPRKRKLRDLLREFHEHPYLFMWRRIWRRLPATSYARPPVAWLGMHIHSVVRRTAMRAQNHSTFFLRNRAELDLICHLLESYSHGSRLELTVLACSKGAEVYSIAWAIRTARPDLKLTVHAVDISQDILDFAQKGVYTLRPDALASVDPRGMTNDQRTIWNTHIDQRISIFERMNQREFNEMFDVHDDRAEVKTWLKENILWHRADANDPDLLRVLGGPQDIVVANRFLCHMTPTAAEQCLHSIARLVKPKGHLFASGLDLGVRAKVARDLAWTPVTHLMRQVYEGDVSLMNDWPFKYWAVEPFGIKHDARKRRYASVFRVGLRVLTMLFLEPLSLLEPFFL